MKNNRIAINVSRVGISLWLSVTGTALSRLLFDQSLSAETVGLLMMSVVFLPVLLAVCAAARTRNEPARPAGRLMTLPANSDEPDLSIVWFTRPPVNSEAQPQFHERPHRGDLHTALERAREDSTAPGFMLGQVLAPDGRVLATVAPVGLEKTVPASDISYNPLLNRDPAAIAELLLSMTPSASPGPGSRGVEFAAQSESLIEGTPHVG